MKAFTAVCGLFIVPTLLIMLIGCEVSSSGSASQAEIEITPNHVALHKGESAEFTASGWYEYKWAIANPQLGVLSHTAGKTTVYTAVAGTNEIQTLTCTATITGTNASSSLIATALIEHL